MIPLYLKRFFSLFLVFALLSLLPAAQASVTLALDTDVCVLRYAFFLPEEEFVILEYSAPQESGRITLHSEDGHFEGAIDLPYSQAGGKVRVTIETLKQKQQAAGTATLPPSPDYQPPKGISTVKVRSLGLTDTPEGLHYSFSAPGAQYFMLNVRSKQQSFTAPIYPSDENGLFDGDIPLPLTYARTLTSVKLLSGAGVVLCEEQERKGYLAPPAPEAQEGRLNGVVVCIDPGHQENGTPAMEPLGPGLDGRTSGSGGMAQGGVTMRKESIVVLEIGVALRDELIRQGATVVMTRLRQDEALTNLQRCQIAEDGGADIMLRLHADIQENKNKQGFSIYCPFHSTYAQAVADSATYRLMGDMLINAMKRAVGYELEDKTGFVTLSDQFVGNNWAKMPCFLVELGFMSNPTEDVLLSTPVYQQRLAEGMAQGVYEIALLRGLISLE